MTVFSLIICVGNLNILMIRTGLLFAVAAIVSSLLFLIPPTPTYSPGSLDDDPSDSPTLARRKRKGRLPKGDIPTLLIVINTSEVHYEDRLKNIRNTWLKRAIEKNSTEVVILGGNSALGYDDITTSPCEMSWWADHCKRADGISAAYNFFKEPYGERYDWLIVVDDDVFLFPDNVQRWIMKLEEGSVSKTRAWGVHGCGSSDCDGYCGGGGYLMTRSAVFKMEEEVDRSRFNSLRHETDPYKKVCNRMGDLMITRIMRDRNIEIDFYPDGNYVWDFDNGLTGLDDSLKSKDPIPWLYHYPAKNNMAYIYKKGMEFGSSPELAD